jgi:hypothetical protein
MSDVSGPFSVAVDGEEVHGLLVGYTGVRTLEVIRRIMTPTRT